MTDHHDSAEQLWNSLYAERPQRWSGRVNAVVAEIISDLESATALDVGCGEGGDVIWLAERGWHATGFDVSGLAVDRATALAIERGVSDRATFERHDLETEKDIDGEFDLVLSSYLHSPRTLNRRSIFAAASAAVAPHGRLLVVGHGAPPPWADARVHDHAPALPDLNETLDELALDSSRWHIVLAEERARHVAAPDGSPAELLDIVVLAQRR